MDWLRPGRITTGEKDCNLIRQRNGANHFSFIFAEGTTTWKSFCLFFLESLESLIHLRQPVCCSFLIDVWATRVCFWGPTLMDAGLDEGGKKSCCSSLPYHLHRSCHSRSGEIIKIRGLFLLLRLYLMMPSVYLTVKFEKTTRGEEFLCCFFTSAYQLDDRKTLLSYPILALCIIPWIYRRRRRDEWWTNW